MLSTWQLPTATCVARSDPAPCSSSLPVVQAALRPELLAVMEARGVTFLPPSAVPVEDYCRSTIAAEQPEDNFYV